MTATVCGALLDAIAARDFRRIGECFAAGASLRVLTPGPLRELEGVEGVVDRYRFWLEPLEGFELLEGDVEEIADRVRIRYRFRGLNPEKGWQLNEHTGYGTVENGQLTALNITCTGFRPTETP